MRADGTAAVRLTDYPSNNSDPAWSPDGTRTAFDSNRDGDYELYVMNVDGTGVDRLTWQRGSHAAPSLASVRPFASWRVQSIFLARRELAASCRSCRAPRHQNRPGPVGTRAFPTAGVRVSPNHQRRGPPGSPQRGRVEGTLLLAGGSVDHSAITQRPVEIRRDGSEVPDGRAEGGQVTIACQQAESGW